MERRPIATLKGPRGFTGPRGIPGLNAVPTDEAVATMLEADDTASGGVVRSLIDAQMTSLPPYAGVRAKSWEPALSLYNGESVVMRRLRTLIAWGLRGVGNCHLAFIGDSKFAGSGAGLPQMQSQNAVPYVFMDMFGGTDGWIYGNVNLGAGTNDRLDVRWSEVTGFARNASGSGLSHQLFLNGAAAGHAKLSVNRNAQSVRIFYWMNASVTSFTVKVDGGAPIDLKTPTGSVTPEGTALAWSYKDIPGLAYPGVAHEFEFDAVLPAGGQMQLLGVYNQTPNVLRVSNAGLSGSTPATWVSIGAFGNPYVTATRVTKPQGVVLQLGTNVGGDDIAKLGVILDSLAAEGIPVLLVVPGGTENTGPRGEIKTGLYDLADAKDLPLIDFTHAIGDLEKATAAGLMTDLVHENQRGYQIEAALLARALAF